LARSRPVARGRGERVVPGGEENVVAVQLQRASEVEGVVTAQGVSLGEGARVAGQWFVDRDGAQLGVEILESGDRADVRRFVDTGAASGSSGRASEREVPDGS
jgi:hypothetical protein